MLPVARFRPRVESKHDQRDHDHSLGVSGDLRAYLVVAVAHHRLATGRVNGTVIWGDGDPSTGLILPRSQGANLQCVTPPPLPI
jgi:hypothetical protein